MISSDSLDIRHSEATGTLSKKRWSRTRGGETIAIQPASIRFEYKFGDVRSNCSDPSYESDPSNEYSPLGLTHVMNSIFLDPSNQFLTQAVNIGIPKQTLGLCFHVSK